MSCFFGVGRKWVTRERVESTFAHLLGLENIATVAIRLEFCSIDLHHSPFRLVVQSHELAACIPVGQWVEVTGIDAVGRGVNPCELFLVVDHELL